MIEAETDTIWPEPQNTQAQLLAEIGELRANLKRTRAALRKVVIRHHSLAADAYSICICCRGEGFPGKEPTHNPVTIGSETFPCPAEER